MPVYEYLCNKCGNEFEKLVFGDRQVVCPKCSSGDIKKKFSVFGTSGTEKKVSSGCSSCSSGSCSTCK